MQRKGTSWNIDELVRTSIGTTIASNATEQLAAAAGHFLIGTANKASELAQCNDDPAMDVVAPGFAFSVTGAEYSFVMREGWSA